MNLYGTVIHFNDIEKLIPSRNKYLSKPLVKKVVKAMNSQTNILFMPNSTWDDKPMQDSTYGKSKYKLSLFGILEDGKRAAVVINDIEPYFEVKIPADVKNKKSFAENLKEDLHMCSDDFERFINKINVHRKMPEFGFSIEPLKMELCKGKPLHNFQVTLDTYIKFYFNKLSHRKDAIAYVRALGYQTAHDDAGSYYRVVSRDYFLQLGSWLNLTAYTVKTSNYIKGDVIHISINDISAYKGEIHKHLLKDNTMTMAFDIETYNSLKDGEIPMPVNPAHNMFMISMTFQWYHAAEQLLKVCLVDVPSAPHPDFLTVICDTEQNLILAFAQIFAKIQPELVMGFNSDNYDWPWIIERAQIYPGLLTQIVELFDLTIVKDRTDLKSLFNYKKSSIKIEATLSVDGTNLQTPGFIPFDVMTVFRKLYPTSEQYSLNFFLSKNKLGGKEDMPYMEMFKIYADILTFVKSGKTVPENLLDKMALVAKYCVVDSARCHDLTNIRNVLQDRREVANISYTSIYDAFYRADGMKVRNLVISRAQLRNLKISNIPLENAVEGKYPGAWVFPPVKGLSVSKLSIQERIQKAHAGYAEYAEWLKVTTDEIFAVKEHITENGLILAGFTGRECFKVMLAEHMGRPITGLDYASLYPSLMMAYNLSPEYMITTKENAKEINKITNSDGSKAHTLYKIKFDFNGDIIRGWSVRHDNHLDATKPEFKFGIFPTILKELFDARKQLKNGPLGLVHWEHEREKLMALPKEQFESASIKEQYADVCFKYNALDSKQRALKVYMNTFYGESGNKRSPLYMVQVAGGITMAGRDNIKRAYDFVEAENCKVYYGDSVTADTPILIRYTLGPLAGTIDIRTIDNIPSVMNGWDIYPQFKPSESAPMRINKQQHIPDFGLETWTTAGWAKIKRVIRHNTNKKIFRVNTHSGCVDVTEDHSLLTIDMKTLSTINARVGNELFHSFPQNFSSRFKSKKYVTFSENHAMVPYDVLNGTIAIRREYLHQFKNSHSNYTSKKIQKVKAQGIYYLLASCGYKNITVKYNTELNQYNMSIGSCNIENNKIIKIEYVNRLKMLEPLQNSYVYDLETEAGTFQAGIGSICVLNTDSLYLSTPEKDFEQADIDYYTEKISKLHYWEQLVEITFTAIKPINMAVNKMLLENNGTEFLKMAFEESLFPVAFLAKKKYFGIPHLSKPNFNANVELFIRGLELKKRGVSQILIDVCNDILQQAVNYENTLTIIEIVQNKIVEFYNTDWSTPDKFPAFILSGVYKPNKQNIKMHTFKRRMAEERGIELLPGERIKYVIVKKYPYKFDMRGCKTALSIGDTMELAEKASLENIPVNIDYYMDKTINGQLARFITYYNDFQVAIVNTDDAAELKKAEDTNLKLARKFIDNYCKQYYTNYANKGDIYKTIFKKSAAIVKNKMIEACGSDKSSNIIIKLLGFSVDPEDNLEEWIFTKIRSDVERKQKNKMFGDQYIEQQLVKAAVTRAECIVVLQDTYYANKSDNILKISEANYHDRQQILEARFRQSINMIKNIYHANNNVINAVASHIKVTIDIDNKYNDSVQQINGNPDKELESYLTQVNLEDFDKTLDNIAVKNIQQETMIKGINELKFIYYNLTCNYEYIYQIRSIVTCLKTKRDRKINYIKPMATLTKKKMIESFITETVNAAMLSYK